jgi:tRNA (adenine57-N1/adenine58-N1)-methyltransferase
MNHKILRIAIDQKTGKKYFLQDLKEDFHTSSGTLSKKDLSSGNTKIRSNKGTDFTLIEPSFPDLWENLQRGPQIIQQKDIGLIISKAGIGKNSSVVDAGGGSGSLCLSLANLCKDITVYEINPEHYNTLSKNVAKFGFTNLKLKQADISQGLPEKDLDLITLDLPEPWKITPLAERSLKVGGFLVVYLPNLLQVKQFLDSTARTSIKVLETLELLERRWKIEDKIMRPEFDMLGHTGFLTFCRRL